MAAYSQLPRPRQIDRFAPIAADQQFASMGPACMFIEPGHFAAFEHG
jgi:hypothetical protein